MHQFDYSTMPSGLLTKETMELLSLVHEYKGRQAQQDMIRPDVLEALVRVAQVQSTEASNNIEGIHTSNKRFKQIMESKTDLISRDEEEIAGYRDVLKMIHENHDHMPVTPSVLLQMHRDLYRHTPSSLGGHFKVGDNEIRGIREDGTEYIRFKPVPAVAAPEATAQLCSALDQAIKSEAMDPLPASLLFVFDFTCIHPFNDGNGRMSRLLTLLLLYKAGYHVGKYISLEKEIERTKASYYEALEESSRGWSKGQNDPGPFVRYMLGVMLAAYRDFDSRIVLAAHEKMTKPERIENFIQNSLGKVRKSDIMNALPDISETTIERTLSDLLKENKIQKVGAGRATAYVWLGQ